MDIVQRAVEISRKDGLDTLCKKIPPYVYEQLWPYLPKDRYILRNGIFSSERTRITDRFLPAYITKYTPSDVHDYEEQYVKCIRNYVKTGEKSLLLVEVKEYPLSL